MEETLDKLLSEPIRPHFALVNVDYLTSLEGTVNLVCFFSSCNLILLIFASFCLVFGVFSPIILLQMAKRLGKGIPIICCSTNGIICRDLETGELKKVIQDFYVICS